MSEHLLQPASFVEFLSKVTAAIVAATYISGFLVVSIHNATFGLSAVNPLKPKILTAGAWFLLLLALPVFSALRFFRHAPDDLAPKERFARAMVAASYYFACGSSAFALSFLLFDFPSATAPTLPKKWQWLLISAWLIVALIAFLMKDRRWKRRPVFVASSSLVLLIALAAGSALINRQFSMSWVTWWFFGVGIVAALLDHVRKQGRDWSRWLESAGLLLATFTIFALSIYPNIKASLGGGSPVPVVIYFSNESRVLPGQELAAELLEESDNGLYIVQQDQKQALFLPRSAVAAVYFSHTSLDRNLLRHAPSQP